MQANLVPVLTGLTPSTAPMGATNNLTVSLTGTNFTSDAVAQFGSTPLATTFVSATQLTAVIPAALLATSAATHINVTEPNGTSGTLTFVVPNPIDLTNLASVRSYLGSTNPTANGDDPLLQMLITGVSQYWLTRTCRGSLNSFASYYERYNGTNNVVLMLRYFPVVSVQSVTIGSLSLSESADFQSPGWVINDTQDGLVLVGRAGFPYGRLNVAVSYTAGYDGTPWDVFDAATRHVAQNFKRKENIDVASLNLPQGGGTQAYRSWEVPPDVERVIQAYRRMFP